MKNKEKSNWLLTEHEHIWQRIGMETKMQLINCKSGMMVRNGVYPLRMLMI